jgi:hypothetical protein
MKAPQSARRGFGFAHRALSLAEGRASTQAQKPGLRSGLALSPAVCAVSQPVALGRPAPRAHLNERAAFVNSAG